MIQEAIHRIEQDFGEDRFTAGDCHHLAAGLLSHFGHGKLVACIRSQVQEDGHFFCRTYSHMVYQNANERLWDIGGEGADIRWESQWDAEELDEDGLQSEFHWVDVRGIPLAPLGNIHEQQGSWILFFLCSRDVTTVLGHKSDVKEL